MENKKRDGGIFMSSIINDLKRFYGDAVKRDGSFLSKEEYVTRMRKNYPNFSITGRQYNLLSGITSLIISTKMTSENTKKYIKSGESSVKKFVENHNLMVDDNEKLKASSVSQNVNYDRQKIIKFLPNDIMVKARSFGWEERIAEYEKMLNITNAKYGGNRKMLNNLALSISNAEVNSNLSEENFTDLIQTIAPYTKHQIKYISENIPSEQIGYLNYLVSASKLENEDLERFKLLRSLLEGKPFEELEEQDPTEDDEVEEDRQVEEDKIIVDEVSGLKTRRIQYNVDKVDDIGSELEEIDFEDITDADIN